MKAIVLTFDSLNRHLLSAYGCEESVTPNFKRLAEKTVVFDSAYVGSMPCMPARREMHTGRYNFLHTDWGGLEPYDASTPALLKKSGVYAHHCTDHYHYWEDGGHHHIQRYSSYECFRGQEGDFWKPKVNKPPLPPYLDRPTGEMHKQDLYNRSFIRREEDWPMHRTVSAGLEFLENNRDADNWLLHIETFDPHEPFYAPQKYRDLYDRDSVDKLSDWPPYGRTDFYGYDEAQVKQIRAEYLALLSFCDAQLGRVLDRMDEQGLWEDTLLVVHTDHGFFLGERDLLGKCVMPFYNEIARIPFFVWDPRTGKRGERRDSLVQTIDLAPTLLEYFGAEIPDTMQGRSLTPALESDRPVREAGLFGLRGRHLNVVSNDGRVLMIPPDPETPLFNYSLDTSTMRGFASEDSLRQAELAPPFSFTKGMPVLKRPAKAWRSGGGVPPDDKLLFDVRSDPGQENPLEDAAAEAELRDMAAQLLRESDVAPEEYARYGLSPPEKALF